MPTKNLISKVAALSAHSKAARASAMTIDS